MTSKLFELAAVRKAVLGVAGVAFAGGVVVGPVAGALDTATTATTPVAQVVTVEKPDMGKLIPHGVQGGQQKVAWNDAQKANARKIVETTKKVGMDERAAVIAVGTAMQESTLNNLGHLGDRNDHDS